MTIFAGETLIRKIMYKLQLMDPKSVRFPKGSMTYVQPPMQWVFFPTFQNVEII